MLEVEVDPIPEDGPAFDAWFERNKELLGLYRLSGKRAWSGVLSTYIRGCDCVIYIDGGPSEFGLMSELTIVEEGK